MPDLRDAISLANRGVDEFVRREAHGLSRARGGHATAAVSDSYMQSLRVLWCRPRFHGGRGRVTRAEGTSVERARAFDHVRYADRIGEVRSGGQGRRVARHGITARR